MAPVHRATPRSLGLGTHGLRSDRMSSGRAARVQGAAACRFRVVLHGDPRGRSTDTGRPARHRMGSGSDVHLARSRPAGNRMRCEMVRLRVRRCRSPHRQSADLFTALSRIRSARGRRERRDVCSHVGTASRFGGRSLARGRSASTRSRDRNLRTAPRIRSRFAAARRSGGAGEAHAGIYLGAQPPACAAEPSATGWDHFRGRVAHRDLPDPLPAVRRSPRSRAALASRLPRELHDRVDPERCRSASEASAACGKHSRPSRASPIGDAMRDPFECRHSTVASSRRRTRHSPTCWPWTMARCGRRCSR